MSSNWVFKDTEHEVGSWSEFQNLLDRVQIDAGYNKFVWRGLGSVDFGLTSSLHRRLSADLDKVELLEDDIQEAEKQLIRDLRLAWNPSGNENLMQVFARMQHRGAVSRLIDVSRNPLHALWFALWSSQKNDTDCRVIGLMLQDYWEHHVPMVEEVSGYPQWLAGGSEDQAHWRDGQLHFWFPGNDLDVRLLSQQGGFVYGALPKQGAIFESSAPETTSTEKRLHSSLNVKFVGLDEVSSNLEEQVAISFVIPKAIRQELFTRLDKGFGINEKQMFPGFDGFIESIRSAQTPIHMRYGASYPCC